MGTILFTLLKPRTRFHSGCNSAWKIDLISVHNSRSLILLGSKRNGWVDQLWELLLKTQRSNVTSEWRREDFSPRGREYPRCRLFDLDERCVRGAGGGVIDVERERSIIWWLAKKERAPSHAKRNAIR